MGLKEDRRKEIEQMSNMVGHNDFTIEKKMVTSPAELMEKKRLEKLRSAQEIVATKKLEIPKCLSIPVNGRMYVITVAGTDMRSPGGLILPPTFKTKKNDEVEGINRYFVVAWAEDIPEEIKKHLCVGAEVHPFLPDAEGWTLPRVVDWMGNNIFHVLHYTELNGVSAIKPEEVE